MFKKLASIFTAVKCKEIRTVRNVDYWPSLVDRAIMVTDERSTDIARVVENAKRRSSFIDVVSNRLEIRGRSSK